MIITDSCARTLIAVIGVVALGTASAQGVDCDRSCLRTIADQVLRSITAHDPKTLPVAVPYRATENGKPSILPQMSLWRTPTSFSDQQLVALDPTAGQIFIAAVANEGTLPAIVSARIKVTGRRITEFEGYITRSQSDTGLNFNPPGVERLAASWSVSLPTAQRASRADLQRVARAAWDPTVAVAIATGCQEFENGEDGLTNVGSNGMCRKPADRPDPKARIAVLDEEQGIAVAIGLIQGVVTTGGTFIPQSAMDRLHKLPKLPDEFEFYNIVREQPATSTVIVVDKYFSDHLQNRQQFQYVQGPGAKSVWVENPR